MNLSLEEPLERVEFERIIRPFVQQSGAAIDEALARCGLKPRDIDRVLLVGGTSKIPFIQRYVAEKLGREPESFDRVDPMTCVAQGAAGVDHYAYSVKLEHSLCANPIDEEGRSVLDPLIPRGSDIPCSHTKTYYPVADPAECIVVSIYEGDVYDDPADPENVKLAEIPWMFDPPRPQAEAGIDVTFAYDDEGILTVTILDPKTQARQHYLIRQATAEPLTEEQVEKMRAINESLVERTSRFEATTQYRDAVEVLRRAEQGILPKLADEAVREQLQALIRQLRQAMALGDLPRMNELCAQLSDRLLSLAYLL
jgi:molecular chaperone DnaK